MLIVLLIAILDFVVGTFIPPTDKKFARGFTGYRGDYSVESLVYTNLFKVDHKTS